MLLERERELGELGFALREVEEGRGHAVGIEAAAGLGKTRLLQEARARGSEAGLNVLAGRATELEQDFPFALVRQLLGLEVAGLSAKEREQVFEGASAARSALGFEAERDRSHDTFAALHALYWVTAALAERRPLLLAVDDAHSADAASLEYLGFLLPRLEELPVLLVLTGRPDEPDPTGGFRRVMADPSLRHVTLVPLGAEASTAMLAEGLGAEPAPDFAAACFEVSGGNPFLLSELSRTVAERGIEPAAENVERVRELVPARVAHTVLMRLDRLSPEARAVASSLAVLGEGTDLRLVAQLSGVGAEQARTAADELRTAAILDPETVLRFIHPLVRSAVYAAVAPGERDGWHMRGADLLREADADLERIASQLMASDPRGSRETVLSLIGAGEKSLAAGAPHSAVSYLHRALREPPPDDLRSSVLEPLITATFRATDHGVWADIEPEVLAELEREPSLRTRWSVPLTMTMAMGGRFEEAASLVTKAVAVAEEAGEVGTAFQLEAQLATLAHIVPSLPEVELDRYRDEFDPDSSNGRLAAAIEARSAVVAGSATDAAAAAKRALGGDGIIFADEPELVAAVFSVLTLVAADEVHAARQAAERALVIAREQDVAPAIARGLSLRGVAAWACGDLGNAQADLRQAVDLMKLTGIAPLVLLFAGPLIEVLVERDELGEAEAMLEELGLAELQMPENPMFSLLLLVRGHLRFEQGDLDRSLDDFLRLTAQAEGMGFGAGPALMIAPWTARGLVARGERVKAREIAEAAMVGARRWGAPATLANAMRAEAAALGGREGIGRLEEALAILDGSPRDLERIRVLVDLGEAIRRDGRRADAREPLRRGLALARKCGAARIAKRAHEELQATGERVRRYTPIGVESLTPSERRVAELAASGMTNRQIAQSLFVTVKTVEAHLSAAYDKLDIGSRRELPEALVGPAST